MDAELLNAGAKVAENPRPSLFSTPLLIDGNEDHNKLTLPFWTYMHVLFIPTPDVVWVMLLISIYTSL